MTDQFDVIFDGELLPESDLETVRSRLAKILKLDPAGLERLFSRAPLVIRKAVDAPTARAIEKALTGAGAACRLVSAAEASAAAPVAPPPLSAVEAIEARNAEASVSADEPEARPLESGAEEDEIEETVLLSDLPPEAMDDAGAGASPPGGDGADDYEKTVFLEDLPDEAEEYEETVFMPPDFDAETAAAVLVTTLDMVPGRRIVRHCGLVSGSTVRARLRGKGLRGGAKSAAGGELRGATALMQEAREEAIQRMIEEARALGANAVVATRFAAAALAEGATEVLVYGTALSLQS